MPNLCYLPPRWRGLLLWIAIGGSAATGGAQDGPTGVLTGGIVSTATGLPVPGAVVTVDGLDRRATTDLDGVFRFGDLAAGVYDLTVSRDGYRTSQLRGVDVVAGETVRRYLPLEPLGSSDAVQLPEHDGSGEVVQLEALVVAGDVAQGSALALLADRQKASAVSDAIGEDLIVRLGVGDAAEAMSKVTGASVVDGKYVFVRGLGDRYSNTLLNGMTIPSADPDRRAVQMDQFPASMLESIVTSKSFTPDQPGGFSGGSVNLRTKSFPDHFFVSVGTTMTYNTAATGEDVLTVPGGGSDWLGRDDGTRALPDGLPASIPSPTQARLAARQGDFAPAEELDRVSKLFHNGTYFPRAQSAAPNLGFNVAIGDRRELGGERQLGYVFGLTYDRATTHYTNGYAARYSQGSTNPESPSFADGLLVYSPNLDDFSFAGLFADNPDVPGGVPAFGVTQSSQNVDWGTYAQVAFRLSLNHEATLRYLHNQSAQDQVKRGVGESTRSDGGRLFQTYELQYTERALDSVQLAGRSLFPGWNDLKIEWRAATSRTTQDQPDYRTLSYFWDFENQQFASAAGVGNNRVFRAIDEAGDEVGADATLPLELGGRAATLKFGGNWQGGDRRYRERRFRWSREANQIEIIENYPNPVGLVDRTATTVTFGNTITELSNRLLNYDGDQSIGAGYVMLDFAPAEKWRVVTGVRAEQTQISTTAVGDNTTFRAAAIDQIDYLPALSVVHAVRSDMNLRAAYGRTVARPLYRELADVRVDDFFRDNYFIGNPDLAMSKIDNFDARWEWFAEANEILAAGVFYKHFAQPIETLIDARQGAIQPRNLDSGRLFGVELEARVGLGRFSPRLAHLSAGGNFSWIESQQDIPADELAAVRAVFPDAPGTRELFGQSPYILNLDLGYSHPERGTAVTLACNLVGKRLALVTADALPEIYERPPPSLDLMVSQRLGHRWRLKLVARNLLDPDYEKSFQHGGRTYFYESYRRGRTFTVGLSYLFE